MIHQPSGGAQGKASDVRIYAERLIRNRKRLNEILSEKTGQPIEKVERDVERDYFMSAEEAKAYGLVDEILVKRR
jgi:ATP-dependent Clp protease protease subunit